MASTYEVDGTVFPIEHVHQRTNQTINEARALLANPTDAWETDDTTLFQIIQDLIDARDILLEIEAHPKAEECNKLWSECIRLIVKHKMERCCFFNNFQLEHAPNT